MFDSSLCSLKGVFKPQLLIIYGISIGKNRTYNAYTWTTSVTRSEQFFQGEAASFEEQIKPKGGLFVQNLSIFFIFLVVNWGISLGHAPGFVVEHSVARPIDHLRAREEYLSD